MKRLASLAAVGAFSLVVVGMPLPGRAAFTHPAEGTKMAVATENADATRAALQLLDQGGNAIDAAVAAALALGVVSSQSSGLGGGGFALVYAAKDKSFHAIDFRERAPHLLDGDELLAKKKRGPSVGVPGEPAGLELLAKTFGKKSLAELAAPAVSLAEQGFTIGQHFRDALTISFVKDRVAGSAPLSAFLYPNGSPLALGTRVTRPELARTLRAFGSNGAASIYEGPTADAIVAAVHAAGGSLEKADLQAYRVMERKPLVRTIDGRTIATMPAPSAGGMMLLETLSMFGASKSSPLVAMGSGSSALYHSLGEAMRGAVADRARLLGDPDLDPGVNTAVESALAADQLAARKAKIDPKKVRLAPEFRTREQGTTHLVVADAEGNVVSLTTTVNGPFGAGIVAGDTGIILNNELDDFSAPKDVQPFGVVGPGANRPRSLGRPVSSMTPTIVLENGEPILALGGSGGQRIATGVTQAAVSRLVFGLDVSSCVSAPRVHVGTSPEMIVDRDVPADVRQGLLARGEQVKEDTFGSPGVQMIGWDRSANGVRITAASDPRKGGFAAAR